MKYFYKVLQNLSPQAVMVQLMKQEHRFDPAAQGFELVIRQEGRDTENAAELPIAKQVARSIAHLVDGMGVNGISIWRLASRSKARLPPRSFVGIQILLGLLSLEGASLLAGDESVPLFTGDAWHTESGEGAVVINNSSDDLFLMVVEVSL
jgi:hypothetical protein